MKRLIALIARSRIRRRNRPAARWPRASTTHGRAEGREEGREAGRGEEAGRANRQWHGEDRRCRQPGGDRQDQGQGPSGRSPSIRKHEDQKAGKDVTAADLAAGDSVNVRYHDTRAQERRRVGDGAGAEEGRRGPEGRGAEEGRSEEVASRRAGRRLSGRCPASAPRPRPGTSRCDLSAPPSRSPRPRRSGPDPDGDRLEAAQARLRPVHAPLLGVDLLAESSTGELCHATSIQAPAGTSSSGTLPRRPPAPWRRARRRRGPTARARTPSRARRMAGAAP